MDYVTSHDNVVKNLCESCNRDVVALMHVIEKAQYMILFGTKCPSVFIYCKPNSRPSNNAE